MLLIVIFKKLKYTIMKKGFLFLSLSLFIISAFAQSDKYMKAMQDKVITIDTTRNPEILRDLSNSFERIGDAEKNQWLPYYYAALAQVNAAYGLSLGKQGMANVTDPMADKAELLINKADALSNNNSEI